MKISKAEVIQNLISFFEQELKVLVESAKTAHEAATHEELKAEDRHDTQAIEASYLAAGQAARIAQLTLVIQEYRSYRERSAQTAAGVDLGSLLELTLNGKTIYTFFAQTGGGAQVQVNGDSISVTTHESPLGQALLGAQKNEEIEIETKNGARVYQLRDFY